MLPVTKGKKTVLCIGRIVKFFHPEAILETIKLLQLELTGIVILDAYMGKDKDEMIELVASCSYAPIYNAQEGEELLAQAELVLTTHELQSSAAKQIFLPMLPLVATAGELLMMHAVYHSLCSRLKGGLTYV